MSDRAVRSVVRVIGIILLIIAFWLSEVNAAAMWGLGVLGFILIMLS